MKRREVILKAVVMIVVVVFLSAAPVKAELTNSAVPEIERHAQGLALPNAPDYDWWYGCTPTSAGMMMGYYDINGYGGLYYDNLVPGGTAEPETFVGPPTGSSALANNTIASAGHIADFYAGGYLASGDDVSTPFHSFNSLADFMGTSQDSVNSKNGSTWIYTYSDATKFYDSDAEYWGVTNESGMYGIGEYITYAGYGTSTLYNQKTDNIVTGGFSFDDYMNEIDNDRVVMLHVEGHSMFGYGYDDTDDLETVYLHDTWGLGQDIMTWGGSYSGLGMWGVTVFELTGGAVVPVPAAVLLGILGLGAVGIKLRRFA